MLVAAAVFSSLAFKITRDQEQNTAVHTYESIATGALLEAQAIVHRKQQSAKAFATVIELAFADPEDWPFVGLESFSVLSRSIAVMSDSEGHFLTPIVRPEEAAAFEAHAAQIYKEYGIIEEAGWHDFGFGIHGLNETTGERFHDISGNTTWGGAHKMMAATLQFLADVDNPVNYLRNIYQFELRGKILDSIIECGDSDANATRTRMCGAITPLIHDFAGQGQASIIFHPIFPANDPGEVVGFIASSINWQESLNNVVPNYVDGLECVISNGESAYTYVIDKGAPRLEGEGDLHDLAFDKYGKSITLNDQDLSKAAESSMYTLTVYPTEKMFDVFRTSIPLIAAVGFAGAIIFCMCLFFLYDSFMQYESNQQKKILEVKRRFVRFISHEIRTPLNVVSMGLDLLQEELLEELRSSKALNQDGNEHQTEQARIEGQDNATRKGKGVATDNLLSLTHEIRDNSLNALSVLNDLLNYDKVESGTFRLDFGRVDIWSSIKKTWKEFAIQARNRKIHLILKMVTDTGEPIDVEAANGAHLGNTYMVGDERRLSQVTRNLLSNALKFTPENETVTISATYVPEGLSNVDSLHQSSTLTMGPEESDADRLFACSERAGSIVIEVSDRGVGLSKNQLGLLFSEGVQFDPNVLQHGGGSGLGLCITKEIVQLHSGNIHAFSEGLSRGTTFTVEMPLYRSKDKGDLQPTVSEAASLYSHNDHHCVLVVDDVLTNTKMLVRVLERAGHKCVVGVNGQEAIDAYMANLAAVKAGETETAIDTILMDFEMPVMNGAEATKSLRSLGCKAHIFGVTGNVLAEDVAMFKASGADNVLFKPISLAAIEGAWENMDSSRRR